MSVFMSSSHPPPILSFSTQPLPLPQGRKAALQILHRGPPGQLAVGKQSAQEFQESVFLNLASIFEPGLHFRRPAQHTLKNDNPRALRLAWLVDFLSPESAALGATIGTGTAMAPRRPPQPLAEDRHYNADFVQRFTQREKKSRVAKRPKALTAAQRAALREQLRNVQFLKPDYADNTKINIAGIRRKWIR